MEDARNLLISYAYNILGSYEEAKDIVQDAYLKTIDTAFDTIENKKAYLIRTVINLSINQKKRQHKLVSQYPGEWLPEPVATEKADTAIIRKEILSYSLMVLLERLDTKQRAVFILKEAFDYDHKEIASVLDITEENSRKIFSRAKQQLKEPDTFDSTAIPNNYLDKYIDAISNADTKQLEHLLKNDVVVISDGGGKASAAGHPVYGQSKVKKYLIGIYQKFYRVQGTRVEKIRVNHRPALLYYKDDKLSNCQVFDFENEKISHIYIISNPDKLQSFEKQS
jgi:RNA polymerase sigma-70 factor (ECF subfamily)